MKTVMAKVLAALLVILAVYFCWSHINFVEQRKLEKEKLSKNKELLDRIWNADDVDDKDINELPADIKERARSVKNLKNAVAIFEGAEDYLGRSSQLLQASPSDKPHLLVKSYYDRSIDLYKKAKEIVDQLEEIEGDNNYNHCLHYTRGEVYYRVLQFIATDEEKIEVFRQTVEEFKKALIAKPRDIDTEINIEILRSNRDKMVGTVVPAEQLLRQMPPQKIGGKGVKKGKY